MMLAGAQGCLQDRMCERRRLRPACTSAHSDQSLRMALSDLPRIQSDIRLGANAIFIGNAVAQLLTLNV